MKGSIRLLCGFLSLLLLCGSLAGCGGDKPAAPLDRYLVAAAENSYAAYRQTMPAGKATGDHRFQLLTEKTVLEAGRERTFTAQVQIAGRYRLEATVLGGADNLYAYQFSATVDGKSPFAESDRLYFEKHWITNGEAVTGVRPTLAEDPRGYTVFARTDATYSSEEIVFYLEKGAHSFTLCADGQPLTLSGLWLVGESYFTACSTTPAATGGQPVTIQGEAPVWRSTPSILEQIDRLSVGTQPVCRTGAVYNTLGGSSWDAIGETVAWSFQVEQTGWYAIRLRCRQDYAAGAVSGRRVFVDGLPVAQKDAQMHVSYGGGWQDVAVTDLTGETLWFYLEAGEHTLSLVCDPDRMGPVIELVSACVEELNALYRRVVMVTSTDPDPYRDYHLDEKLSETFERMGQNAEKLRSVTAYIKSISDSGRADSSVFGKLIRQLEKFAERPLTVVEEIGSFNSNISALGTWIMERSSQPLEVDRIAIVPYGSKYSFKVNTLAQWGHSLERIVRSYTEDYNVLAGSGTAPEKAVTVWANTGRDQAQIISQLANETFTKSTGVGVSLEIVAGNALMMATVAGQGPDVSLFNPNADAVNYALRNAVVDLSGMEGFHELAAQFRDSAIVPFRFNGGAFALPETQSFNVLFYRKDILAELGLEVPRTWTDAYNMIADLQKNNMTFGMGADYATFLYQYGGAYYGEEGAYSLLNSPESVEAYKLWTSFYTDFDLDLTYNFLNRFRSGEMPIAVQPYTVFNSLVVYAPEIREVWGMALLPGVEEGETVNRASSATGTCAFLLRNSNNTQAAWEFLRWWAGAEAQGSYAREMEIKLGPSARVAVANTVAFEKLLWNAEESAIIAAQWESVVGTPEVAGGYMVGRHINNAFRKIVYNDKDIWETLNEYTTMVDKELQNKRKEFGLA